MGNWLPQDRQDGNKFSDLYYKLGFLDSGKYGSVHECLAVPTNLRQARKAMKDKAKKKEDLQVQMTNPNVTQVVKIIKKSINNSKSEFRTELEVLKALVGENFVLQYFDAFESSGAVQLVLKKEGGGSFASSDWGQLFRPQQVVDDEDEKEREPVIPKIDRGLHLVHTAMTGMSNLHKKGYTHNDGHVKNWMLSGSAWLADTVALLVDYGKCLRVQYNPQQHDWSAYEEDYEYLADLICKLDGKSAPVLPGIVTEFGGPKKKKKHKPFKQFKNKKLNALIDMLLKNEKCLAEIIADCHQLGLFPSVLPGTLDQYVSSQNGGGFQAGYSDDEGAVGGAVEEERSGEDKARLAKLKRVQKRLLAEQQKLQDDVDRTEDLIRKLRRTRLPRDEPAEPSAPAAQAGPVMPLGGLGNAGFQGGLNPFMAMMPGMAMAMGMQQMMQQQPQPQPASEVEELRREVRRLRALLQA